MASDSIVFREIDRLVVEGRQEPELVFEVLGRKGEISPSIEAMAGRFAEGLAAYRARNWRSAAAAFESALEAVPEDGPSQVFRARVQHLEIDPPPPDWKGEWTLHEK
jgi:adenylate cyclase